MFIASLAAAADMSNSMELSRLYIIGDATPYQWNIGETPEMARIAEGVFRWSGKLEGGREFKFLNARDFHKHIFGTSCRQSVSAGNTYTLTYVADWALDGSRDFKFVPSETADYTIYVDLNTMMMSVREQEEPVRLPATLYATGSALGGSTVTVSTQCKRVLLMFQPHCMTLEAIVFLQAFFALVVIYRSTVRRLRKSL